jgi:hypothetical protein
MRSTGVRILILGAGLLSLACSDRPRPAESARGLGSLAERMLADRAADWRALTARPWGSLRSTGL